MSIKEIFDEIAAEPSSNKKMEILSSYKENEILKRVLYLANSKRVKFWIKQIPDHKPDVNNPENLIWGLDGLKLLSTREVTGHKALGWLGIVLSGVSPDDAYVLQRIIDKDCRIGMAINNINKIFPKLIEETPYMGAKSFDEKLARKIFEKNGFGFSQIKMDGRYCNAIIRSGDVELESRQGEPTIVTGAKFLKELSMFKDCVLNGELTMDGVTRYESNGIIASLVSIGGKQMKGEDVSKEITKFEAKHMSYEKALNDIRFTIWDTISIDEYFETKSSVTYKQRILQLQGLLVDYPSTMVSIVENKTIHTYEEAMSHFQEVLNSGHEGTILKSADGTWKDGKPNWQVKMKLEMDVDLRIIGFNYGTGKNEHLISSLNAESADGKVITRPTGISEDMMKYITENQSTLLNTIVEVKSCGLSHDSQGNYALLHPVFKKLRDDKNTCDSLESIQEIEAMAKGLATK